MSKKKVTRVRTGCWTCRRRGYKCDEGKPECNNCLNRKVPCEGYALRLKWTEDKLVKKFTETVSLQRHDEQDSSGSPGGQDSNSSEEEEPSPMPLPGVSSFQMTVNDPNDNNNIGSKHESDQKPVPRKYSFQMTTNNPDSTIRTNEDSFDHNFGISYDNLNSALHSTSTPPPSIPIPVSHINADPSVQLHHLHSQSSSSSSFPYELSSSPLRDLMLQHELTIHYLTNVAEDLCPVDTYSVNIYRDIIVPFSADSTKYAICGLTAHYLGKRYAPYALVATEFKVEAIKALRISLESLTSGLSTPDLSQSTTSSVSEGSPFPQDVLSTSILLATQEALSGNYDEWRSHVKGGAKLLRTALGSHLDQADLSPEIQVLVDTLVYHDAISTIMGDRPLLVSEIQYNGKNPDSTFSSLAAPVYRTVSRISFLACMVNGAGRATSGLTTGPFRITEEPWPAHLSAEKAKLQQQLESQIFGTNIEAEMATKQEQDGFLALSSSPSSQSASNNYHILTNILRNCALLYFWLKLDPYEMGKQLNPRVVSMVSGTLDLFALIPLDSGMNTLLAWPLWQVGVCSDTLETQELIMDRLSLTQSYNNRGGIKTVIRFLSTFWNLMNDPAYVPYTRRELLNLTKQRCSPVVLF